MRLYTIKRVSDGMYLRKIEGHYSRHVGQDKNAWSLTPAYMLRTPDGVAMNLRKLCSVPCYPEAQRPFCSEIEWRDFDPDRLSEFEVVVMEVDVVSSKTMPAADFAQIDKIASIPLTRTERLRSEP